MFKFYFSDQNLFTTAIYYHHHFTTSFSDLDADSFTSSVIVFLIKKNIRNNIFHTTSHIYNIKNNNNNLTIPIVYMAYDCVRCIYPLLCIIIIII